jgi:hypothetical protein
MITWFIGFLKHVCLCVCVCVCVCVQCLNCKKNKCGVDNFTAWHFIVIVITHRRFSIINNGEGIETDPPGYLVWGGGLSKQLGVQPQPPAIQTLGVFNLLI